MPGRPPPLDRRFRQSTRGRIVDLLRADNLAVDQMADALGLTTNAIRAHLATLERDGIVRQEGTRKGMAGKPAAIYALATDVSALFSRAYAPVLSAVLAELGGRMSIDERRAFLRAAGRRLGASRRRPGGPLGERVGAAAALLEELGGVATVETREQGWAVQGQIGGCPLASVVRDHDDVCVAVEAMMTEFIGAPVRERCARGGRGPACRFEVARDTA